MAIHSLKKYNPKKILDIATGTGDLALAALKLKPNSIIGVDISEGMLQIGRQKMKAKSVHETIEMISGDSTQLIFEDNSFDAVMVAFGVRNFANLSKGITEMVRVVRVGQPVIILEFSKPTIFPVKQLFGFYFRYIVPSVGKLFSKDARAYSYLQESVQVFPEGDQFANIMDQCGLTQISINKLTFGICSLYFGIKK
jgi:demethylmenaquinone methyltransferase/2-methoxy-6-polyprenyl-1,4-benzoquinol methylase